MMEISFIARREKSVRFANKIKSLESEFMTLKKELYGDNMFVVLDESDPKVQRYNNLLGLFYPNFRTSAWINPLTEV